MSKSPTRKHLLDRAMAGEPSARAEVKRRSLLADGVATDADPDSRKELDNIERAEAKADQGIRQTELVQGDVLGLLDRLPPEAKQDALVIAELTEIVEAIEAWIP